MTAYIYPSPTWLEESAKLYGSEFEGKLKSLSGHFAFKIHADPSFGIEKDKYMCMVMDAGKLTRLALYSEEDAQKEADFILAATPAVWKRILQKLDKFVGAFMGGRIKLEKGDTVGALALGPHANTLVDVITQVDLIFGDDLSPDELESYKAELA
jgi:putative sterol carrier protein